MGGLLMAVSLALASMAGICFVGGVAVLSRGRS